MAADDQSLSTPNGEGAPESRRTRASDHAPPGFVRTAMESRARAQVEPSLALAGTDSGSPWHLVRVEPADESPDMLRRIEAEQAPRVCLVVLEPVPALQSLIVLRALRSLTASGQVTLGLHTRDQGLLGMARIAGWETPSVDAHEAAEVAGAAGPRQGSSVLPPYSEVESQIGAAEQASSLGQFWQATRRLWTRDPQPLAPQQERPRTAAEALAAVAAGSSARLRGARPALAMPAPQLSETANTAWADYRYVAAGDTVVPVEHVVPRSVPVPRVSWWPALVVILAVALLAAYVFFLLPNARVTLQTAPVAFTSDVTLIADARVRGIDVADGKLPARVVSVEAADTMEIPTTGQEVVPDHQAGGEVLFTNRLSRTVVVPQETVVRAGNVSFTTTSEVVIPGSVFVGPQQSFGIRRVKIEAITGGSAGNVAPEAINAVDGSLRDSIEVRNDQPTRGGTDRTVRFVTAEDRQQLYNTLFAALREQAEARLGERERTGESLVVWPEPNPAITEEVYEPADVRAEATAVRLRMKVRYSATQFRGDEVNRLLSERLAAHVDSTAPGWVVVNETLQVSPPGVQRVEPGVGAVYMLIQAQGHREPNVDAGQIRSDLAGRSRSEAQAYLDARPGFAARELAVWPGWTDTLPRLPFRIDVEKQRLGP